MNTTLDTLLALKAIMPVPRIVCLCGSTRFAQAFQEANLRETLAGKIVLSIGCDTKSDNDLALGGVDKTALDFLHLFKIDLADEILVLNVDDYIGESTRREIAYARLQGKPIRWLEPHKEMDGEGNLHPSPSRRTLYTIGYRTPGAMQKVEELVSSGALLLDIRFKPVSRFYPQWSRKRLQLRFGWQNYEHLQVLGNVNYRHPELSMQLCDAEEGLRWLMVYLQERDVVLLCGCPDPKRCHRSLVARLFHERQPDIPILHLVSCPVLVPQWEERRLEEEDL